MHTHCLPFKAHLLRKGRASTPEAAAAILQQPRKRVPVIAPAATPKKKSKSKSKAKTTAVAVSSSTTNGTSSEVIAIDDSVEDVVEVSVEVDDTELQALIGSTSEAKNVFTELRKAANHPLLLLNHFKVRPYTYIHCRLYISCTARTVKLCLGVQPVARIAGANSSTALCNAPHYLKHVSGAASVASVEHLLIIVYTAAAGGAKLHH
jgi:hypothetical protein